MCCHNNTNVDNPLPHLDVARHTYIEVRFARTPACPRLWLAAAADLISCCARVSAGCARRAAPLVPAPGPSCPLQLATQPAARRARLRSNRHGGEITLPASHFHLKVLERGASGRERNHNSVAP